MEVTRSKQNRKMHKLLLLLIMLFTASLTFAQSEPETAIPLMNMEVVLMLAGVEAGNPNWAVVVLGNLFVCGMEGLIVGIQVLRLEYYELFSRFYRGTGRAFRPYGKA